MALITPFNNINKADKVTGAVAGDLATLDATGNLKDSGKKPADFVPLTQYNALLANFNTLLNRFNALDISAKADKVDEAVAGDVATLDESGNLTDSGAKLADFVPLEEYNTLLASFNALQESFNGLNLAGKADKVASAVAGDIATLDGAGNLTDSGAKPSDFVPVSQYNTLLANFNTLSGNFNTLQTAYNAMLERVNAFGWI